jgi:hypothetical protein
LFEFKVMGAELLQCFNHHGSVKNKNPKNWTSYHRYLKKFKTSFSCLFARMTPHHGVVASLSWRSLTEDVVLSP